MSRENEPLTSSVGLRRTITLEPLLSCLFRESVEAEKGSCFVGHSCQRMDCQHILHRARASYRPLFRENECHIPVGVVGTRDDRVPSPLATTADETINPSCRRPGRSLPSGWEILMRPYVPEHDATGCWGRRALGNSNSTAQAWCKLWSSSHPEEVHHVFP